MGRFDKGRHPLSLGDMPVPEDAPMWFRDYVYRLLGVVGRKPIDILLRDYGEIIGLAPQLVPPVFNKPFKSVATDTLLPHKVGVGPDTLANIVTFQVPKGQAAIVTTVFQELEALGAYADVNIRLFIAGRYAEYWLPTKPETMSVCIPVFYDETIAIQAVNTNAWIDHWMDAQIMGYHFPISGDSKSQEGLRVDYGVSRSG